LQPVPIAGLTTSSHSVRHQPRCQLLPRLVNLPHLFFFFLPPLLPLFIYLLWTMQREL
jgi:hypothetical protein